MLVTTRIALGNILLRLVLFPVAMVAVGLVFFAIGLCLLAYFGALQWPHTLK